MIFGTIYKGSTVHYSVEKIKFLRPDIALVFLRQHLELAEGAPVDGVGRAANHSRGKDR